MRTSTRTGSKHSKSLPRPPKCGLVAVAASAGGVEALKLILSQIPDEFVPPLVVVLHRTSHEPDLLPQVLGLQTRLPVKRAEMGEYLHDGTIYLAPPHMHLWVNPDRTLSLIDGPRVRHVRSSANPLFDSAAKVFGESLLGVVLTGHGRDATDGVQAIRAAGGTVIAQNPFDCRAPSMPLSAIRTGSVDWVLPLEQIPGAILSFARAGRNRGKKGRRHDVPDHHHARPRSKGSSENRGFP